MEKEGVYWGWGWDHIILRLVHIFIPVILEMTELEEELSKDPYVGTEVTLTVTLAVVDRVRSHSFAVR